MVFSDAEIKVRLSYAWKCAQNTKQYLLPNGYKHGYFSQEVRNVLDTSEVLNWEKLLCKQQFSGQLCYSEQLPGGPAPEFQVWTIPCVHVNANNKQEDAGIA